MEKFNLNSTWIQVEFLHIVQRSFLGHYWRPGGLLERVQDLIEKGISFDFLKNIFVANQGEEEGVFETDEEKENS